jgi:hypothetical protein
MNPARRINVVSGFSFIVVGIASWWLVRRQLAAEQITVTSDSAIFAGRPVRGPLTAYTQAKMIDIHARSASGGRTYAELERDDPARATVMNAAFLRASLFTSILSFGAAALAIGFGLTHVASGSLQGSTR